MPTDSMVQAKGKRAHALGMAGSSANSEVGYKNVMACARFGSTYTKNDMAPTKPFTQIRKQEPRKWGFSGISGIESACSAGDLGLIPR